MTAKAYPESSSSFPLSSSFDSPSSTSSTPPLPSSSYSPYPPPFFLLPSSPSSLLLSPLQPCHTPPPYSSTSSPITSSSSSFSFSCCTTVHQQEGPSLFKSLHHSPGCSLQASLQGYYHPWMQSGLSNASPPTHNSEWNQSAKRRIGMHKHSLNKHMMITHTIPVGDKVQPYLEDHISWSEYRLEAGY